MKKIAVFDFDGSLSKGYISMGFLDFLYEKELYPKSYYKKQQSILKKYKAKKLSYEKWCALWGKYWIEGLKGIDSRIIEKQAKTFFKGFKKNIYKNSYKLIESLKKKGYHTIILSLGAKEVMQLAANELTMDECYASDSIIKNNKYTGKANTDLYSNKNAKEKQLKKILKDYNLKKSIGLGDSITDVPFIEMLEIKVASNPSEELRKYITKDWQVLDLNKNYKINIL